MCMCVCGGGGYSIVHDWLSPRQLVTNQHIPSYATVGHMSCGRPHPLPSPDLSRWETEGLKGEKQSCLVTQIVKPYTNLS